MIFVIWHTTPTEICFAPKTLHMRATSIFFYSWFAFWALSNVFPEEKSFKTYNLTVITNWFTVPRLLTLETSICSTFFTGLSSFIILFSYSSIAWGWRTPNQLGIHINLMGKSVFLKRQIRFFTQEKFDFFFFYRALCRAETI